MAARLFVVIGPSGVGKTHLIRLLLDRYPKRFVSPPLFTTRPARTHEEHVDRIFISEAEFTTMQNDDAFRIVGSFNGSRYGYTHEALAPHDKHAIINTWPAMLPQFTTLPSVVIIGMTTSPDHVSLLQRRIKERQESAEIFRQRMERVTIDLEDMRINQQLIRHHGQLFDITDDSSTDRILGWIAYNYV